MHPFRLLAPFAFLLLALPLPAADMPDPPGTDKFFDGMRTWFKNADKDQDELLDRKEIAKAFGYPDTWKDPPKDDKIAADADKPKDELSKKNQSLDDKPENKDYRARKDFIFLTALDKDKDGKVSKKEFEEWARGYAVQLATYYADLLKPKDPDTPPLVLPTEPADLYAYLFPPTVFQGYQPGKPWVLVPVVVPSDQPQTVKIDPGVKIDPVPVRTETPPATVTDTDPAPTTKTPKTTVKTPTKVITQPVIVPRVIPQPGPTAKDVRKLDQKVEQKAKSLLAKDKQLQTEISQGEQKIKQLESKIKAVDKEAAKSKEAAKAKEKKEAAKSKETAKGGKDKAGKDKGSKDSAKGSKGTKDSSSKTKTQPKESDKAQEQKQKLEMEIQQERARIQRLRLEQHILKQDIKMLEKADKALDKAIK